MKKKKLSAVQAAKSHTNWMIIGLAVLAFVELNAPEIAEQLRERNLEGVANVILSVAAVYGIYRRSVPRQGG